MYLKFYIIYGFKLKLKSTSSNEIFGFVLMLGIKSLVTKTSRELFEFWSANHDFVFFLINFIDCISEKKKKSANIQKE